MKKNLITLFSFLVLLAMNLSLTAQQTGDEVFVIDINIDGQPSRTFRNEQCGFSAPADWGGPIPADFCVPVVWGYDITPDSIGCDSIAANYAGKLVMIRRGACEFGRKMLWAQIAGAAAGAVANGYAATHGTDCNNPGMGAGAVGPQVTQMPVTLFSRTMTDYIDAGLKAGKQVTACYRRLSLYNPTAEYSFCVPKGQAHDMNLITVRCVNRTGVDQDFFVKAVIVDPSGATAILRDTQFVGADGDSLFAFESYLPSREGLHKITYTAEQATAPGDTVTREFRLTPYTWATDNLNPGGGAFNDASFVAGGNIYQSAGMVRTGANGAVVSLATFGINNAKAIAIPGNSAANVVDVLLYDADPNDDDSNDIGSGTTAFSTLNFIAFTTFEFDSNTVVDQLQHVALEPVDGDSVRLKPNHLYYVSVLYNGAAAATGKSISFTVSPDVYYGQFTLGNGAVVGLQTPLILDDSYSGWGGSTVVTRLHEAGYDPLAPISVNNLLDESKFAVTPNPANEQVALNFNLASENKQVVASLIDFNGRTVATQIANNVTNGQIRFDARSLPSGVYAMSIHTTNEGHRMAKLMICH